MGFLKDLRQGQAAENKIKKICQEAKLVIEETQDKSYDFLLCKEKKYRVEVKRDFAEARTGNVAVEIWNCNKNRESGPLYNTDVVVYVFNDESRATTPDLIKEMKDKEEFRLFEAAGDGNATILLFKRFVFNKYSQKLEDFLKCLD